MKGGDKMSIQFQTKRMTLIGFAMLLLAAFVIPSNAQNIKPPIIMPDTKIQKLLSQWINAPDEYHRDANEALKQLKELAHSAPKSLAPQLIYRMARAKNEKEALGMLGLTGNFSTDSELRFPLVPFLESDDEKILEAATIWLHGLDGFGRKTEPALDSYLRFLLRQKESPPPGLVKYLYEISPGHALLVFGKIYSDRPKFDAKPDPWPRPLMWSDHLISTVKWRIRNRFLEEGDLEKARKELDTLSKHEGWYVRRYVVHVIDDVRQFRTQEIVDRLKKDTNPLVADQAKLLR
jgi:hypothetical protein